MRQAHPPENTGALHRTHRVRRTTIIGIIAAMIVVIIVVYNLISQNTEDEHNGVAASTPAPLDPEPICRAEGEFVAGFMSPQDDDAETAAMLDRMNTDAVTFGGRIEPATPEDYPAEVIDAVGDRKPYAYSLDMNWDGMALADGDTALQVGDTEYGIIQAGEDSVVITTSTNGIDRFHSLTRVSSDRENQAFIGLPIPQMRTTNETWLPDNSYANVVDGFNKKFTQAYHQRGADGFYLVLEMPLTDAAHWDPITEYYSRQIQLINEVAEGTTVLISPYLEGRASREIITPETAAGGYQKFLDLHNGTRILVSPQDGLGVDTTALEADASAEHQYTAEDYFEALHTVEPDRLYVTIEAMRPGGGSSDTREPTSRDRVEEQLDATQPYVQGGIGFQWAEPNSMVHIPHIGRGACAAGPGELQ